MSSSTTTPLAASEGARPAGSNVSRQGPSVFRQGEEAFSRDLPALLKNYAGKWVAYLGAQRLDVADSSSELYRRHAERGINPKDLFVELIHPAADDDTFALTDPPS